MDQNNKENIDLFKIPASLRCYNCGQSACNDPFANISFQFNITQEWTDNDTIDHFKKRVTHCSSCNIPHPYDREKSITTIEKKKQSDEIGGYISIIGIIILIIGAIVAFYLNNIY